MVYSATTVEAVQAAAYASNSEEAAVRRPGLLRRRVRLVRRRRRVRGVAAADADAAADDAAPADGLRRAGVVVQRVQGLL